MWGGSSWLQKPLTKVGYVQLTCSGQVVAWLCAPVAVSAKTSWAALGDGLGMLTAGYIEVAVGIS